MTTPKRHGLLTGFLIFKIVALTAAFCIYAFGAVWFRAQMPQIPSWVLTVLCFSSLAAIVAVIAIFRWMKWGFYLICATSLIALAINLSYLSPVSAFGGLLGPVLLFGLLQLGGEDSAWSYLK